MKDKLVQLIAIFYGIDPTKYEVTFDNIDKKDSFWANHSRVRMKKIKGDYYGDPHYQAEAYDLEPITIKDGGYFPDEYAGKTIFVF